MMMMTMKQKENINKDNKTIILKKIKNKKKIISTQINKRNKKDSIENLSIVISSSNRRMGIIIFIIQIMKKLTIILIVLI